MTRHELIDILSKSAGPEAASTAEVEKRYTTYCDLRALNLIAQLVPARPWKLRPPLHSVPRSMIIGSAEHDFVWITVDIEELAAVITIEQVEELAKCGVIYDSGTDSLGLSI